MTLCTFLEKDYSKLYTMQLSKIKNTLCINTETETKMHFNKQKISALS